MLHDRDLLLSSLVPLGNSKCKLHFFRLKSVSCIGNFANSYVSKHLRLDKPLVCDHLWLRKWLCYKTAIIQQLIKCIPTTHLQQSTPLQMLCFKFTNKKLPCHLKSYLPFLLFVLHQHL